MLANSPWWYTFAPPQWPIFSPPLTISGGTRSEQGSETKSIMASLFGTWRLQERNPYHALHSILSKPRLAPV